jgi:hypothetical protein
VLKEDAHRGQGVVVLPRDEAVRTAISARHADGSHVYELAQEYIRDQYTVAQRRFYLRQANPHPPPLAPIVLLVSVPVALNGPVR